ncbi:MAG TPA: hypothetical protein VHQ86_05045, partial [Candidatus Saccharimonadia bacterium]|nr:hypothetical protein [Candidatus Saccharimonadia bacterium]
TSTTPTISNDLSFGPITTGTTARTIGVEAQTGAFGGNGLTISAGQANGATAGGLVTIQGGAASATSGSSGGGVTIQGAAGTATSTGGAGGAIQITGGNATSTGANNGGGITLQAGSATGTGTPGSVLVKNAADAPGAFRVQNAAGTATLLSVNTTILVAGPGVAAGANTGGTLSGSSATTYYYKVSAISATGESVPSTEVSINGASFSAISTPGAMAAPTAPGGTGVTCGTGCTYKVTFVTANGETTVGTASASVSATNKTINLTGIPTGASGTIARNIYRATNGGGYLLCLSVNDNSTTTASDSVTTCAGGPPATNTARTNTNNVTVTFTAVTGATSYRIYRGTTPGGETAYQTTASSPFTDTGAAGTSSNLVGSASVTGSDSADSSAAFRIQNNAGSASVLNVDTLNQRVGINTSGPSGALQVYQSNFTPGNVNTTNGVATVAAGSQATTFTSTFQPGDTFTITASGNTCTILSIQDDSNLTCTANLTSTQTNSAYSFTPQARLTVKDNGQANFAGALLITNPGSASTYSIKNDSTDNTLKLSSNTVGYTSVGNNEDANINEAQFSMYNSGSGGTINSIRVYFRTVDVANPLVKGAVYTNNGSTGSSADPSTLMSSAAASTITAVTGWNTLPLGQTITLAPNTNYWFGFLTQTNGTPFHLSTGIGQTRYLNLQWGTNFPTTFGTHSNTGTDFISMYANYITITGPATTNGAIRVDDNNDVVVRPNYDETAIENNTNG